MRSPTGPAPLVLAVLLAPLLLGAADPRGDVVTCRTGDPAESRGFDIVAARALLIEDGTALEFRVRLSRVPTVPDLRGHPFRIDIVLEDPRVRVVDLRPPYGQLNRILRFDATDPPSVAIFLLPERAISQPSTHGFDGALFRLTVAGRQITEDEDLEGFDLRPIRWNVIVRKGPTCDYLRDGRPTLRLAEKPSPAPTPEPTADPTGSPSPGPTGSPGSPDRGGGGIPWAPAAAGLGAVAALAGGWLILRRSRRGNR